MMYGVIPLGGHGDRSAHLVVVVPGDDRSFLLFAIVIGLIARMGEGTSRARSSTAPATSSVALIIGIARGITVIMNNGEITDTVLNWCEARSRRRRRVGVRDRDVPALLPLSFLIPSSSGLATVAMPIMAPLASFVDVPEQLVVTAYQSASGLA